jgi:hypothetical protein
MTRPGDLPATMAARPKPIAGNFLVLALRVPAAA